MRPNISPDSRYHSLGFLTLTKTKMEERQTKKKLKEHQSWIRIAVIVLDFNENLLGKKYRFFFP